MIGIITFHSALNYGAVLQTYALQKKIEELGGESEVIDYKCNEIEDVYKWIRKRDYWPVRLSGSYFKRLIRRIFKFKSIKKRRIAYKGFVENYLKLSEACYDLEGLKKVQEKYHAIITGSDQVWNDDITGADRAYFLNFIDENKKKFSYAASVGNMGPGFKLEDDEIELLKKFNKISVREEDGKKYIEENVKVEAKVHVDPTLTIESHAWDEVAVKPEINDYILLYTVNAPISLVKRAKEIAKKENLKIIYIIDKVLNNDKQITYVTGVSPEEYVGYFKYAKYIMTNSFHGTVFSVIFKRKFLVELESTTGKNRRVGNLLSSLELEDRTLKDEYMDSYNEAIDWENVDNRLNLLRKEAEEYLKEII